LPAVIMNTTGSCNRDDYGDPNDQATIMMWDSLERSYLTHIPDNFNGTGTVPLVIAIHGGGGDGEAMVKLTEGGFNKLADEEGFVVIYPDAIEKNWNDGRSGEETGYRAHLENIDDVGFISALIDSAIENLNIDRTRVYVTGISNGAMMTLRLGCELSDKIAAIAPVAGNIPENLYPGCNPDTFISVMLINGVGDPLVPYEGGYITGPFGVETLGKVISTDETINFWINNNGCSALPAIINLPDIDTRDGSTVIKSTYSGCEENSEVILYTITGGGHTWPGGYQYLSKLIIGNTCRDIDANEAIWNFFKSHSR